MAWIFGATADTRITGQPQSFAFGLFLVHSQTFSTPESLGPLGIHSPTLSSEQCRDPSIAVAAVQFGN
jgi:hypothetical protein